MKRQLFLVIFFCSLLANCATKNTENGPRGYFPNSIGNQYIYRVTDSLNNKIFNVVVSIVGKSTLANSQPVTLWTYKYLDKIDTSYVFANKDSVVFYQNRTTDITQRVILNLIRFPLVMGAKWRTSFQGDTSTVISNGTIDVNGKTFANTYLIHDFGRSNNYTATTNQWFTPKAGLVKMDYITQTGTQNWELINYTLK